MSDGSAPPQPKGWGIGTPLGRGLSLSDGFAPPQPEGWGIGTPLGWGLSLSARFTPPQPKGWGIGRHPSLKAGALAMLSRIFLQPILLGPDVVSYGFFGSFWANLAFIPMLPEIVHTDVQLELGKLLEEALGSETFNIVHGSGQLPAVGSSDEQMRVIHHGFTFDKVDTLLCCYGCHDLLHQAIHITLQQPLPSLSCKPHVVERHL